MALITLTAAISVLRDAVVGSMRKLGPPAASHIAPALATVGDNTARSS